MNAKVIEQRGVEVDILKSVKRKEQRVKGKSMIETERDGGTMLMAYE